MKFSTDNLVMTLGLIVVGVGIGIVSILFGKLDDAPGILLIGILMMIVIIALGVKRIKDMKQFS
jgi:hypothetical protein